MPEHPLDQAVHDITTGSMFLTAAQAQALQAALPKAKQLEGPSDEPELTKQISAQLKLLERIQNQALGSEDIAEMRQVMAASRDLFNLLIRFQDKMETESKQSHIENAVYDAFEELGDEELKANYLKLLRKYLSKKS